MRTSRPWTAVGLAAIAVILNGPAHAEDIVVTAQRREESIKDVPVAMSAFDQTFVERARLDDVKDVVTYTPGFSGNSDDSYIDSLAVRGITSSDYGIGGDPSIAIFKDGVYQGRTGAAVTSLYDIERAEALRGPQGFLFGRNAISGAISIITNKPDPTRGEAHLHVGYAAFDRKEAEGAVNLPAGQNVAIRLAGYVADYDGWIDNAFTPGHDDRLMGGEKQAVRGAVRVQSDAADFLLTVEHERRRLDGTSYRASNADREVLDALSEAVGYPVLVRGGRGDVDTDLLRPRDDGDITSVTASAEVELGFGRFSALSAFRSSRFFYLEDYDGTSLLLGNYAQRQRADYASQDVRVASADDGRLTWSAGASLYWEKVKARFTNEASEELVCTAGYGYADCNEMTADLYGTAYQPAPSGILVDINDVRSRNTGWSVFADANYAPTPRLTGGVGLRYARDRKRFTLDVLPSDSSLGNVWTFTYFTQGPVSATKSWGGLTPRAYVKYSPTGDLTAYASITRGHKAGGFGSFTIESSAPLDGYRAAPVGSRPDAFSPETVWSKEVGLKGQLWGGRLTFDLAGFHYAYRNLQTVFFNTATRTQEVINVGRVTGVGLESALSWRPSRFFELAGHLSWTRTVKRGDRDCDLSDCGGLPNPTWSSAGMATVRQPLRAGELYLQGEWSYEGRRRESSDWRGITRRDAYAQINLRAGWSDGDAMDLIVYVENVFDAFFVRGAENGGDLTPANVWGQAQPRTIGVDVRLRFD